MTQTSNLQQTYWELVSPAEWCSDDKKGCLWSFLAAHKLPFPGIYVFNRTLFLLNLKKWQKTWLWIISFEQSQSTLLSRTMLAEKSRYTLGKDSSCCRNVFQRLFKMEHYEVSLWIFMHVFVYLSHYRDLIIQSPSTLYRTFQRRRGHLVQYDKK